ncbi:antitermination protein NusG [Chryseobacterium pennae]|uniref:Antitermination protein NusG n=1 Tax=Chryseobacterium pennae TaxID=2258962 RepID=A0A3D9C6F9_9FLAO|nr:transcription termination/antitermination NusG family protein [Chryseobacterium pennae]REC61344.1 antitermination protein NusG [Chryseobacterium pennae]
MSFIQGWYVIYTKSRYEKKIGQKLNEQNFKANLPLNTIISQWSDRKKKVESPLFSSYVFVYLETIKDYFKAFTIVGVILFIKLGDRLVRILDDEIYKIKIFLNQFSEVKLKGTLDLKIDNKQKIC